MISETAEFKPHSNLRILHQMRKDPRRVPEQRPCHPAAECATGWRDTRAWRLDRQVVAKESAVRILAPMTYKRNDSAGG